MFSRRTILALSIGITLVLYAGMLWVAPLVTLLESNRSVVEKISNRFSVEFLEPVVAAGLQSSNKQAEGLRPAEISAVFGEEPGTLPVEDTLVAPPVETPQLSERMASESLNRAYDLAPEPERVRNTDARILEIAQGTARQDINVVRSLIRPSPEFTLPEGALPALRSRGIEPEDIPLEPARLGAGLLAQAMAPPEEQGSSTGDAASPPPYDPKVFGPSEADAEQSIPQMEKEVIQTPIYKESQKAREESDFTFMDDLVDIRLDTYVPSREESGYFRLRILPRQKEAMGIAPKDITFILDASKSMQQRKLDLVVRGIADTLDRLRPEDKFNILLFRDTVTPFQPETVMATPETVAAAKLFLEGLESRGQTDVYNALLPIARFQPRKNLPGIILVVTDGNPTTGERDSRTIINSITGENGLRNSIFTYSAGNTVNQYLLDLLAYRNKGEAKISPKMEDARNDLLDFTGSFSEPLLVNLSSNYGRVNEEELYPRVIPDFFQGRPLTLYGRFEPEEQGVFVARIVGYSGDTEKEMLFRADLGKAGQGGFDVAQGWAFEKAYHLIGEISKQGELPELLAELRQLSDHYKIRTIYDE